MHRVEHRSSKIDNCGTQLQVTLSTALAPWPIIPADHKWFTRLVVTATSYTKLKEMKLAYPSLSR